MGKVVLDDQLYESYYLFKHPIEGYKPDRSTLSRILRYAGDEVLTNKAQLDRLRKIAAKTDRDIPAYPVPTNDSLYIGLTKKGNQKDLSLVDLAAFADYKIILTKDAKRKGFPYVNIDEDEIEMVLGGFVVRGASRAKALAHLKALCRDAREITIYDAHFCGSEAKTRANSTTLKNILPTAGKLEISYHQDHLTDECVTLLKKDCPKWEFKPVNIPQHHDRYLIVDDMEIILTSGFDRLYNSDKEITYIVHDHRNRFGQLKNI